MYHHALPDGFVLRKDKTKEENLEEKISLEELIENGPLGPNVTRITLETFLVWKRRKRRERIAKDQQDMERNRADFSAGRSLGVVDAEDFQDIDVARFIPKENLFTGEDLNALEEELDALDLDE
ncbi:unnamed protein product [Coregonus sp. 'balchen']|nr:unnamed protein product [Coregonus sp. 'balchen']